METLTTRRAGRTVILCLLAVVILVVPLAWPPARGRAQELEPGYWERSILPQMGLATYYAPGMMDYVHDYRIRRGQLPECADCVGSVALLRAGDIGRKVWLQPPGGELAGPFLVVDCARPEDIPPLLDRNWVVDLSYDLGQTWGMTAPLDGVIVWADPAEGNAPAPKAQPTLFYIDPRDVIISAPTQPAPATPTPVLPTRLPAPRGTPRIEAPASATPARPTPLTPVITTPTPPGGGGPTAQVAGRAPATPAPLAANAAVPAQPGGNGTPPVARPTAPAQLVAPVVAQQVSLGRAGHGLLAMPPASTRPVVVEAMPVATVALVPHAAPRPVPLPTAPPMLLTPTPPKDDLLHRVWNALMELIEG